MWVLLQCYVLHKELNSCKSFWGSFYPCQKRMARGGNSTMEISYVPCKLPLSLACSEGTGDPWMSDTKHMKFTVKSLAEFIESTYYVTTKRVCDITINVLSFLFIHLFILTFRFYSPPSLPSSCSTSYTSFLHPSP